MNTSHNNSDDMVGVRVRKPVCWLCKKVIENKKGFDGQDNLYMVPKCGHTFHRKCIERHAAQRKRFVCPQCLERHQARQAPAASSDSDMILGGKNKRNRRGKSKKNKLRRNRNVRKTKVKTKKRKTRSKRTNSKKTKRRQTK